MNRETIFTVRNEDLTQLNQNTAVNFFQKLLWAEARRLGIEISKINVSSQVNIPDGGVDATVDDVQIEEGQGIIKQGKTSYQIKAGTSFKPWQQAVIEKELFGTKTPELQNLGESIRACLDADGTYILVCTGIDLVDSQHRDALKHIEDFLNGCDYLNPKVEVWSQNTLIGFLQVFPSLVLQVNRSNRLDFQTRQSWAENDTMKVSYVSGESQEKLIAQIQNELRQNYDTVHLRVLGEPGIGKTRLALEATSPEDLAPLLIYCTAAQFRGSELMREILRDDSQLSVIVVIDECDRSSSSDFWDKLRHRGSRIKLISIYNEHEVRAGGISYYDTPPLNDDQIRSIIQQRINISNAEADRWGELCGGSPRVAHVIGENLVNHPEDLLKPPSTVEIWERYVAAGDDREKTERRRLVLQHLALFKQFGYEQSVAKEAEAIAEKIKSANPNITSHEFANIIYELGERRILQGESTLYITPKALQIWLWTQLEERDFFLEEWLKEGDSKNSFSTADEKGALDLIPRGKIWEWIDRNVEDRAWYFAYRLVPKTLSAEEWQDSLVRAFLIRYGQREDVRRNLHANYSTESWTGERSLHLESKKSKLLGIRAEEDNPNVKRWLDAYIEQLKENIEHARIDEEREF